MSSLQALQAVQKARNWKIWIDFGHHECQFFHIQASPQLGECDGQKLKRILSGETEWTQQSLFCFKGPHEIPCHWKIIIVAHFGTMVGKIVIARTLAGRTQWDFNMPALACGVMTFLDIVTGKMQQRRCGLTAIKPQPHSF